MLEWVSPDPEVGELLPCKEETECEDSDDSACEVELDLAVGRMTSDEPPVEATEISDAELEASTGMTVSVITGRSTLPLLDLLLDVDLLLNDGLLPDEDLLLDADMLSDDDMLLDDALLLDVDLLLDA